MIFGNETTTDRERTSSSSYFHQEEAEQEMNKLLTILDGQPSRLDGKYSKSMNKGECAHYYYRKGTFYDFLQKSDALGRENHAPLRVNSLRSLVFAPLPTLESLRPSPYARVASPLSLSLAFGNIPFFSISLQARSENKGKAKRMLRTALETRAGAVTRPT